MEVLLFTLLTIFAAGVGTLTGFGTSTIIVPVVLLFFPLPQTLLLVGVIHLFGDLWKMLLFRQGIRWKLILSFGIPGVIASFIGASLIFIIPDYILSRVLGVFIITYTLFLVISPSFQIKKNTLNTMFGGVLSGFFAGIFGMGGAIRSAFLAAFNLPKSVYIASAGAIALFTDITRLSAYLSGGVRLEPFLLWGILLFIPASFAGAYTAKGFVEKIPQKKFRMVIALFLFLIGVRLLIVSF